MTRGDFALLCERTQSGMYAVAMQILHNTQQAEDAVQNAFVRMLRIVGKLNFENERVERVYCLRTVKCAAIDLYRAQKSLDDKIDDSWDHEPVDNSDAAFRTVSAEESVNKIASILSPRAQAIFSYRSMGLSDVEIAASLDIGVSNVRSIVYRARLQIANSIEQEEGAQRG